ncbi:MAG: hypothetical protein GOV00_02565 [Candidatus Altiarchaeota archaeon]|nr:hypothetical protein [Candidatus Altiarchaeota archaeon]
METKVFVVEKSLALKIVGDAEIKRKADAEYYDGAVMGLKEGTILIVRGEQKIFEMAFFKGLEETEEKESILKKLDELQESSSVGVGALFG